MADRKGAFEEADGGVIFLDEIADLNQSAQVMLLRTLSTGEFRPLGATRSRVVDVRVVSATNRPLNQLVMTNEFRYDLLFRLRQFHVEIPALRDRGDDWRLMTDFWLTRLATQYGVAKRFSTAALGVLERYDWPGNVRQLIGIVKTGYAMAERRRSNRRTSRRSSKPPPPCPVPRARASTNGSSTTAPSSGARCTSRS